MTGIARVADGGGKGMNSSLKVIGWSGAIIMAGLVALACSSVDEKPAPTKVTATPPAAAKPAPAPAPAPAAAAAKAPAKTKAVEVEGVISAVGQRTITFQLERKGKIREEVVGVDAKTKIEKGGANVKLSDLQATDKGLINYEPEMYTPAIAIKITGKGEIKKVGGDD
jgi:multidrug efflux pump subunit AcrA (membrane-fusion protein)